MDDSMSMDKMLDLAIEMKDWLVKKNVEAMEGEMICRLCEDRLRSERYYKTFDLDKVEMRLKR